MSLIASRIRLGELMIGMAVEYCDGDTTYDEWVSGIKISKGGSKYEN